MTKEELLKTAKEELARLKEDALDRMLRNNLETAHTKNVTPFPETGTKLRILDDRVLWKAALLGVTDKDIERIVASLPDIGISATEREEKIKKIDEEIAKLSKSLETEFRELQS